MNKRHTLEAAARLGGSELPLLLTWAPGDKYFPISYAERLAGDAGNARIVEIPDARTFVPLDQPQRLAEEIAHIRRKSALTAKREACAFPVFRKVHVFRLTGGPFFRNDPLQDGELCPRRSSTRTGRRSTMAQKARRSVRRLRPVDDRAPDSAAQRGRPQPPASSSSRISGSAAAVRIQEPRAL